MLNPATDQTSGADSTNVSESRITTSQWKSFAGAFGGWALDGFNVGIFGLVMAPAMTELLPKSGYQVNAGTIGYFGQLGVAIFLAGWGCSFLWGPIADRIGRLPAMMYSIVVYATFTCLAGFSRDIWQLSLFRFVAAIGIGGEWAMAGTFVAETMPERLRPMFGGILHSGVYLGTLLCSVMYYAVGIDLGWRWMFYLGLTPAVLVIFIRSQAKESGRWVRVSGETRNTPYSTFLSRILRSPYRRRTWLNVLLLFVALTGFWAGSQYLGTAIQTLAAQQGIDKSLAAKLATFGLALLSTFSVIGCLIVPWLANRIGRRHALALLFALMFCGIVGTFGWGYYAHSMTVSFAFIPVLGLGGADLAVFTVWLPEQYPTEIRATAFAFCTTISRFAAAAATFLVGRAIAGAGTLGWPLALTAVPFLFGVWLSYSAVETKGEVLPD